MRYAGHGALSPGCDAEPGGSELRAVGEAVSRAAAELRAAPARAADLTALPGPTAATTAGRRRPGDRELMTRSRSFRVGRRRWVVSAPVAVSSRTAFVRATYAGVVDQYGHGPESLSVSERALPAVLRPGDPGERPQSPHGSGLTVHQAATNRSTQVWGGGIDLHPPPPPLRRVSSA